MVEQKNVLPARTREKLVHALALLIAEGSGMKVDAQRVLSAKAFLLAYLASFPGLLAQPTNDDNDPSLPF